MKNRDDVSIDHLHFGDAVTVDTPDWRPLSFQAASKPATFPWLIIAPREPPSPGGRSCAAERWAAAHDPLNLIRLIPA
jgi:hypothetical protein